MLFLKLVALRIFSSLFPFSFFCCCAKFVMARAPPCMNLKVRKLKRKIKYLVVCHGVRCATFLNSGKKNKV